MRADTNTPEIFSLFKDIYDNSTSISKLVKIFTTQNVAEKRFKLKKSLCKSRISHLLKTFNNNFQSFINIRFSRKSAYSKTN